MEVFISITSEPAFASSVQELVYDGRLFWQYLTDPDAHGDMYRHAVRPTNEKKYDEETDTYVQLAELCGWRKDPMLTRREPRRAVSARRSSSKNKKRFWTRDSISISCVTGCKSFRI